MPPTRFLFDTVHGLLSGFLWAFADSLHFGVGVIPDAPSVAVQRVVAFNILEYRYTSLPKGRVAAHAQAEPGGHGADWDDDEPEAHWQQEPGEGAAPGGGEGLGQEAALSEGAAEGDIDVPLVGGH